MKTSPNVIVKQNEETPVPKEVLAEAIIAISRAARILSESGLNEKAIVILIADRSGISRTNCSLVLNAIKNLQRDYCR